MAGLMESPAVWRAATDMLDCETVVVAGVGWAAATCGVAVCVGCELTCCTADWTGCKEAVWCWNMVWVFVCSWGWTEFRTVAAEQRHQFNSGHGCNLFISVFPNGQ